MIYTCNVPGLITTAVGGGSVGGSVGEGEGLELYRVHIGVCVCMLCVSVCYVCAYEGVHECVRKE